MPNTMSNALPFRADILQVLVDLSRDRPVFHSEADFKFALAMKLQSTFPYLDIRLEVPWRTYESKLKEGADPSRPHYIDLVARKDGYAVAIELKYKTDRLSTECKGEFFELKKHSAYDCGLYDCFKDIERLERFVDSSDYIKGYAIWLTNDPFYVSGSISENTYYKDFSLRQGRELTPGKYCWNPVKDSVTKDRTAPIQLEGSYAIDWKPYGDVRRGFYVVVLEIGRCL